MNNFCNKFEIIFTVIYSNFVNPKRSVKFSKINIWVQNYQYDGKYLLVKEMASFLIEISRKKIKLFSKKRKILTNWHFEIQAGCQFKVSESKQSLWYVITYKDSYDILWYLLLSLVSMFTILYHFVWLTSWLLTETPCINANWWKNCSTTLNPI